MRQSIQIFNVQKNCLNEAKIVTIEKKHVRDFEQVWIAELAELGEEDKYWDWAFKKRLALNDDGFECYALECNNMTQGLINLETQLHRSWFDESQKVAYIRAIATAPWNRALSVVPQYKLVGTRLLAFARKRSVALGYSGRVGLHSLPEAIAFYRKLGMPELDSDPDCDDLIYFEFGPLK